MFKREFIFSLKTRPVAKAGLVFFVFACLLFSNVVSVFGQWRPLFTRGGTFTFIYFLDKVGAPLTGFACMFDGPLMRTTDGGNTWTDIPLDPNLILFRDMVFKDSLTGWIVSQHGLTNFGGCLKTIDGGKNWIYLSQSSPFSFENTPSSIFYDTVTNGLFSAGQFRQLVSWDEGNTWGLSYNWGPLGLFGYSSTSDSEVVFSNGCFGTRDGGRTWFGLPYIDSNVTQPIGISGTHTYLSLCYSGAVLRTDDMWKTLRTIPYSRVPGVPFGNSPAVTTGSLCRASENLIAQSSLGCYLSRDTGLTWESLCGPISQNGLYTAGGSSRFYAVGKRVYVQTIDAQNYSTIWTMDIDSIHHVSASVSSRTASGGNRIKPGDSISVDYFFVTDTLVGVDTVGLTLRFDSNAVKPLSFATPVGWVIRSIHADSGILHITLADTETTAPQLEQPILTVIYATFFTASGSTSIYLDSTYFSGNRLNCDVAVQSTAAPDSVRIDFNYICGDSTLQRFTATGSPFEIVSITPNPASSEVSVTVSKPGAVAVTYALYDQLGREVLSRSEAEATVTLDVSALPEGVYYLRASCGGFVKSTRLILVKN